MGEISRTKKIRGSGQIEREEETHEFRRQIQALRKDESLLGGKEIRQEVVSLAAAHSAITDYLDSTVIHRLRSGL